LVLSGSAFCGDFIMELAPDEFGPTIKLTKLDAACRQLRTAIHLWFTGGDPVSTHALAFAAHELIHRLYKLKGLDNLLFDTYAIKDEYRGEWAKTLKKEAAFLKHADTDPHAETLLNPVSTLIYFDVRCGLEPHGRPGWGRGSCFLALDDRPLPPVVHSPRRQRTVASENDCQCPQRQQEPILRSFSFEQA
jgi:hypothetical protein